MTRKAPAHLAPETARWWRAVVRTWALEEHHIRILGSDRARLGRQRPF